jgi:MarR family transcriptional regulator, organic hydroperoxide resistance regulator
VCLSLEFLIEMNSAGAQMSEYRLTTSFPYLARRVGLRIGEMFGDHIARFGITVSMYRVMAVLSEQDGQRLGELGALTSIELSTLSRLVGTMARKGLVSRRRPNGNGRVVEISLTARGRDLAAKLMPSAALCENVAIAGLSPADIVRLKSYLEIAYRNLDKLEGELAQCAAEPTTTGRRRTARAPVRSPL